MVRTTTERQEVMNRVRQGLAQTAGRLSAKIKDILDGTAGLPASGVSEIVPAVVTLESWHPEALTTDLIGGELQKEGIDAGRFQLMSIGDLEWLLTWAQYEPPAIVLRDKPSDPALDDLSANTSKSVLMNRAYQSRGGYSRTQRMRSLTKSRDLTTKPDVNFACAKAGWRRWLQDRPSDSF